MHKALWFEELEPGVEYRSPTRTIAESDLYLFAGLTGDMTDFHISTVAAAKTPFGRRVAHGMLLVSIANGLYNRIGVTDGTGVALTGINWRFRAPAFIGDTILLVIEVREKRPVEGKPHGVVFWRARLVNQDEATLGDGEFVRMVAFCPDAAVRPEES